MGAVCLPSSYRGCGALPVYALRIHQRRINGASTAHRRRIDGGFDLGVLL
jgi:hypothetical protein